MSFCDEAVGETDMISPEEYRDRATIIRESDATCDGCGADPRAVEDAAGDPAWFISVRPEPDRGSSPPYYEVAVIRCPICW